MNATTLDRRVALDDPAADFPAELRTATRDAHDAIERVDLLADLFRPGLDRAAYRRVLEAQLGFYAPLERDLRHCPPLGVSLLDRFKTHLLRSDLRALGATTADLARVPERTGPPLAADPVEALGVLYVVEGATLGGKVILRQLERALGSGIADAQAFYGCYGRHCRRRFTDFRTALISAVDADPHRRETLVAAANRTFAAMTRWFDTYPR